jgi:hypothetical protein
MREAITVGVSMAIGAADMWVGSSLLTEVRLQVKKIYPFACHSVQWQ